MFSDTPQPKRKHKESLAEAITEGVVALSKAFGSPSTPPNPKGTLSSGPLGLYPAKSIDLRMKNLEQLRYLQHLFEDNILTEDEFMEQKRSIIDSLREVSMMKLS